MNGLSLLIALATVGVNVGWESGPNQQLVYTVRIESVVHQELRNGQAVVSTVAADDRGIRKFRIAMGPKAQVERSSNALANEVQYGWRPSVDDPRKVDYFVQVLPERLETLAQGIPVECEVHQEVPEVHFIYFFQGNAELPRQLPVGLQSPPSRTQTTRGADESVRPAANSVSQPSNASRFGTPALEGSRFPSSNNAARGTIADSERAMPQRTYESDRGWREEVGTAGGTSVYGPDPPNNYRPQQNSLGNDRYNASANDMIPIPGSRQQPPYRYSDDPYDRYASRTEAGRPPADNPPTYRNDLPPVQAPPANDETTKQLVALIKEQQDMLKKQQTEALAQQIRSPNYGAITPPGQPSPGAGNLPASDEGLRTPLVVTMLALFASLCANAYIGWLAWSFFWRFRNAASDLARAQTAATARAVA